MNTVEIEIWDRVEELLVKRNRVIGSMCGFKAGPAVAFCAGIHGNEPSGVVALMNVIDYIQTHNISINGSILGFIGNRNALHNKTRFVRYDLNRMWTKENIETLHSKGFSLNEVHPEILEMVEMDKILEEFINDNTENQRVLVDLHTTSSFSHPFAVIDQREDSYKLVSQLPLPFISNLDQFLKGTLLSYLDHKNFSAFVFEAGKHDDPFAVLKHEAVIWLILHTLNIVKKEDIENYETHYEALSGHSDNPHKVYEIVHRHEITKNDGFRMKPGFINFQKIRKGEVLAHDVRGEITSPYNGRIFMPLYQGVGTDGFFVIQRVNK